MRTEEIRQLLRQEEGQRLEFKSWSKFRESKHGFLRDPREQAAAFANAKGGVILLGVEDDAPHGVHTVTGCTGYDVSLLERSIRDGTEPHLSVAIEEHALPGGVVLAVRVPAASVEIRTGEGKLLGRYGSDTRPLTSLEHVRLRVEREQLDITSQAEPHATLDDIDPVEVGRIRNTIRRQMPGTELVSLGDDALLTELGLISDVAGSPRPTMCGILCAGTQAALRRLYPQAEIAYLHYNGAGALDDQQDLELPLLAALARIEEILSARRRVADVRVGLFSIRVPDFPEDVVREALLNAMCHRDYTHCGRIVLRHNENRMVIESPGGFPGTITPANILHHPPHPRNPSLARLFQRLGYVERAGLGIDRMFRVLLGLGKAAPEFADHGDFVVVAFGGTRFDPTFAAFVAREENAGRPLTADALLILTQLRHHRQITAAEAARLCQAMPGRAATLLADMHNQGHLERAGKGRGTYYRLARRVYDALGASLAYYRDKGIDAARHREMVLQLVRERGRVKCGEVMELCGLSRNQASWLLRTLVAEGALIRHGTRRWAHYELSSSNA